MEGEGVQKHCSKNFPKSFSEATVLRESAYPEYRRRSPEQGGQTHKIKLHGQEFTVDNSWVVPYNPFLSLQYEAHINIEIVYNIAWVKYLYKYITKGNDRIIIQFDSNGQPTEEVVHDEIEGHINVKYTSASEAIWKIRSYPLHYKNISVVKLPCHLENEQFVVIPQGPEIGEILPPVSKLTAFFEVNKNDDLAKKTLYIDMPKYFVWIKGSKETSPHWQRRQRGKLDESSDHTSDAIGRINRISLNARQSELYYLRMLLHHKTGPTCHTDLKRVHINHEEVICDTFQEACLKLGLIDDDTEINRAMKDASTMRYGDTLIYIFLLTSHMVPTNESCTILE